MFYSPAILAKKGDLSKVWLAAHWQHKLSKQQVFSTDIGESVTAIMEPKVALSLRLSGQLLHGVARIHQRKVGYLYTDCAEALVKIKMAFRPGAVNLSVQETSTTPARINAPTAQDEMGGGGGGANGGGKFQDIDIKVDDDDWMKMTPMHTTKRSITRSAARVFGDKESETSSVMDEKEDLWSPFQPEESMNMEQVRAVSNKSKSYEGEGVVENYGGGGGGADYYGDAGAAPGEDFVRQEDESSHGQFQDTTVSGLMLKTSWVDDNFEAGGNKAETQPMNEENAPPKTPKKEEDKEAMEKRKKRALANRRRKKTDAVTEISGEEMQANLSDTSKTMLQRATVRERVQGENDLRRQGFQIRQEPLSFERAMRTPSVGGMHPRIQALFEKYAKPVPAGSGEREAPIDDEEMELVRREEERRSNDESGGGGAGMDYYGDAGGGGDYQANEEPAVPPAGDKFDQSFASRLNEDEELDETRMRDSFDGQRASTFSSNASGEDENRKWSPRTVNMMNLLRDKLNDTAFITYQDLAANHKRSVVAGAFFEILQLKTWGRIELSQDRPYADIFITKTTRFEAEIPT